MSIPILGDLWGKVVDKSGDIISELVTDKDLATRLKHEFQSQMSREAHDFKTLELQAEKEMHAAHQATVQAELQQADLYTKRTRPKIARMSFYAGLGYGLMTALPPMGFTVGGVTFLPWVFQWEVLMLMYSPALAYMGVRGFEKWKHGK